VDVATSWKSLRDSEQDQSESIQALRARVKELEEASREQRTALAESEKNRLRLQKLSDLRESTLQSTLNSCERMVKDMKVLEDRLSTTQTRLMDTQSEKVKLEATLEVELQSSGSLRATIQSLQAENLVLKSELQSTQAARDQALSDKEKLSEDRDQALSEKGVALTVRDQVRSELEQVIADKKQALDLQISAFEERREAVERIEELHLQVVELTRELSQVSELRDLSWAVGFNWGFKHYRSVAKSAPPGDESFKDLDINTIQILDAALETMARLGVEQFPHVTDWSQKSSQPVSAGNSDSGSTSSASATASSPARGDAHLAGTEVPSSSNAPDNP
jgi:myosin heavy subunit